MKFDGRQWLLRFYRREVSDSLRTVSIVAGIFVLILVFLVSPKYSFPQKIAPKSVPVTVVPAIAEAEILSDPEPLFLATPLNYSINGDVSPNLDEQNFFLAFGSVYYINHDKNVLDDGFERSRDAGLTELNAAIIAPPSDWLVRTFGQSQKTNSLVVEPKMTIVVRSRENGKIVAQTQAPRTSFELSTALLKPMRIFCYGRVHNRRFLVESSSGDATIDQRIIDFLNDWTRQNLLKDDFFTIEVGL